MPRYCVDKSPTPDGAHVLHDMDVGCPNIPSVLRRQALGVHTSSASAGAEAARYYEHVSACPCCLASASIRTHASDDPT